MKVLWYKYVNDTVASLYDTHISRIFNNNDTANTLNPQTGGFLAINHA